MKVTENGQLPIPATRDVLFKAGLYYQFNEAFALMMGVKTDPAIFSTIFRGGFGFNLSHGFGLFSYVEYWFFTSKRKV